MSYAIDQARRAFASRGGTLRTREALAAGVHPRTLYAMRDAGQLDRLSRGLYRLSGLPPLSAPDLAIVAKRMPQGVVCLISALAYHELTTQVPHAVYLAVPRTARAPVIEHPPLQVFRFSPASLAAGIVTHIIDGVPVRIYNPEKTLADCFKYRHKLGLDVVIEALRRYRGRKRPQLRKVLEYARVCRVETIVRLYLEAGL